MKKIKIDSGNVAIEYVILMFFISLCGMFAIQITGTSLKNIFCIVSSELEYQETSKCASKSTSSDTSSSSASSSNHVIYTTQNAGHSNVSTLFDLLQAMSYNHATSLTGIYDSNGNELTSPHSLANYLGISNDQYDKMTALQNADKLAYENYVNNSDPSNESYYKTKLVVADGDVNSYNHSLNMIANNSSNEFYVPDQAAISITTPSGSYTENKSSSADTFVSLPNLVSISGAAEHTTRISSNSNFYLWPAGSNLL